MIRNVIVLFAIVERRYVCPQNDLNHSQWLKSIRERKQGFIKGWTARTRKALSDITRNVLHYQFLYATFVCVWFIVSYQLSLRLIGAFNALLLFLGVSCSGGSYLHKINDMVRAFYLVRFAQLTYLINQSNWFALSFDESTSKVCLNSCFKVRKCEITKMRQKKIPFTCVTCQVNEMSKKRTSKRKRKRRKKT
eukprot:297042_1